MRREEAIERLRDDRFDLLVVGGGITGCGVALDAASRGLSVALVERDDFAAGTSSRSSKLIHGGLRYLQRLEVRLVREALRERQLLQRLAPFLVWPTQFLVPLQRGRPLVAVRAGLVAYDLLAAGSGASRHRRLDQPGARQLAWALGPHVTGAYCYPDARTDDARLVWTIARTAGEMGAVVANHAPVLELLRDTRGRASGAVVSDVETGEPVHVRARAVVNASGVWVDEVRRLEDPAELAGVRPAKGIHLTFPASA
ncbi:MAG TPA: FAD-dependent oxidoreductase, partial [Actinomycetota bacterium]|nr:FAD-dependent oxidoreductase [Actinomycetota bacterium]